MITGIPVPEESSTATTMHSSKTQVTRTVTFFKEIPQLILLEELSSAQQLVKSLFCNLKIPTVTDKRSEYFADTQEVLNSIPLQTKTKKQEKETIPLEVENLLKGAVEQVCPEKDQFLSNIFILKNKVGATDLLSTWSS